LFNRNLLLRYAQSRYLSAKRSSSNNFNKWGKNNE
jgi:hypothetical protein